MNKLKSIFALGIDSVDYSTDIVSFELSSDESDSDSQTFSEYNAGSNRDWTLTVTGIFDGGSVGSLHDYLWANAGTTTTFLLEPKAGASDPSNPKYRGDIRIPYRPDIMAEAGENSTFEYEFEVVGQPIKVIGGEESDLFGDSYSDYF